MAYACFDEHKSDNSGYLHVEENPEFAPMHAALDEALHQAAKESEAAFLVSARRPHP
jgi:hypothetical protein